MTIDMVTFNKQQQRRQPPPINLNCPSMTNGYANLVQDNFRHSTMVPTTTVIPNDLLIELIKSTKINTNNEQNAQQSAKRLNQSCSVRSTHENPWKSIQHPFHIRRLLRSIASTSGLLLKNNQQQNLTKNSSKNIKKNRNRKGLNKKETKVNKQLDSIQEDPDSKESNCSSNNVVQEQILLNIPQDDEFQKQQKSNCDKDNKSVVVNLNNNPKETVPEQTESQQHHSLSASTETIKIEDKSNNCHCLKHQQKFDTKTESIKENERQEIVVESTDSPINNIKMANNGDVCPNQNEEILEILRQVLRMCTKMDLSKRASASEVHEILDAKLLIQIHHQHSLVRVKQLRQKHQQQPGKPNPEITSLIQQQLSDKDSND